MSTQTRPDGGGRALLVDGTAAVVCRLGPPDHDAVADLIADSILGELAPGAPAGRDGVRDVLARVAWLGAVLPELAAVEIDPLVVTADGGAAHAVRVRFAPPAAVRPWSRDLPL